MRISDSRYARERSQFELAMRMIAYEARTCTIRTCTGLSDDRIRKIYTTYFKGQRQLQVRRQRGKPPSRISVYVKNPMQQVESTTLALLFCDARLLGYRLDAPIRLLLSKQSIDFGQRFCLAYDVYCLLHPKRRICFERAWFLVDALSRGDELQLTACVHCGGIYVHDTLALVERICPACASGRRARAPRRDGG